MLTAAELNKTAKIITPSIEETIQYSFEELIKERRFDPTRVYRILIKSQLFNSGSVVVNYLDVILPEHHNESGMDRKKSKKESIKEHVCTKTCRDSVRLIPVGCESLLHKYKTWWYLISKQLGKSVFSMVVEQDAKVAQDQIRASKHNPLFIFNLLQFVTVDSLIIEKEDKGKTTWFAL